MSSQVASSPRAAFGVLFVGALVGTGLVAYTTGVWGPAVNELALHHFTAAEGLRAGTGLTLSRGEPFVMWPPLMPVMLAIARSLGLEYTTAGLLFNLVAHTATLCLSALLLWRLFGSLRLAVACQAMLFVSPELLRSAATLQTEPIFFALVLAGLYLLVRYLECPTWGRLSVLTLVTLLACLQRYTGVALVVGIALVMLCYPGGMPLKKRLLRAGFSSAIALLPLALWMVRNHFVNRTWGVIPAPAQLSLVENLRSTGRVLARFLTLDTATDEPMGIFEVLSGLVALGLFMAVCARLIRAKSESERRPWAVYLVFPPVYLAVLLFFTSVVALDPIGNRYIVPVYPFLWGALLLGFREVHLGLAAAPIWFGWAVRTFILALFAAHLLLAADRTRMLVVQAREEGIGGFTTRAWRGSPLVGWLRANPPQGALYSNLPEIVIFAVGSRATYVQPDTLERALEQAPAGAHVIWVERLPRHVPFPQLSPGARRVVLVVRFDTAVVYRVEP